MRGALCAAVSAPIPARTIVAAEATIAADKSMRGVTMAHLLAVFLANDTSLQKDFCDL
jgi:hypothetical protein